MNNKTSARAVSVDPALVILAGFGLILAIGMLCLSFPFAGPTVQDLVLPA